MVALFVCLFVFCLFVGFFLVASLFVCLFVSFDSLFVCLIVCWLFLCLFFVCFVRLSFLVFSLFDCLVLVGCVCLFMCLFCLIV